MVLERHRAVCDVADICVKELGGAAAARLIAGAAVDAIESSIHNAELLDGGDDAIERRSAMQAWNFIWLALARARPEAFAFNPRRLDAPEAALAYALGQANNGGLRELVLNREERRQLHTTRQMLRRVAPVLSRLGQRTRALVITEQCPALRGRLDLIGPGCIGTALGSDGSGRRTVLLSEAGVQSCRSEQPDGEPSELALLVLHEELHVAFARAARKRGLGEWEPLPAAAEEAVVSALDLAAETYWVGKTPDMAMLIERAPHGYYGRAVQGLLCRLDDRHQTLAAIAELGASIVRAGKTAGVAQLLNAASGLNLSPTEWRQALPVD